MSQISQTIRARDILRKKFKFNSRLLLTNELEMSSVLAKQKSLVDVPFLLRTNSKNTTVRELWRIWLLVFQTKCNCRLRFAALWCPLFYASVVRNTKPILNVYIHLWFLNFYISGPLINGLYLLRFINKKWDRQKPRIWTALSHCETRAIRATCRESYVTWELVHDQKAHHRTIGGMGRGGWC